MALFILIINAIMLALTGWLSKQFGLGLQIDGFWPTFSGIGHQHRERRHESPD